MSAGRHPAGSSAELRDAVSRASAERLPGAGRLRTDRRRLTEPRLLFEEMLGYGNHLGLHAGQTGPNGEALGNFPQVFTHLALISAAFYLDWTLSRGRAG
jgi:GH15 family glucan-1,4-alpha-glucosidase